MKKKIEIKSIRIKNFRSIRNEYFSVENMNIFVGMNDVGKSNVLKALNLFFNGQTDYNVDFDFKKDFSYLFPKTSHGTKEIVIEIQFAVPDTYKESGLYTWKKVWRTGEYSNEVITNQDGEKPSDRSRVPSSLKRIRYRYVPAVKSNEYYRSLLSDLYFTVSAVIDSPLESSIGDFSKVLQEYTSQISEEVGERVGINSKLSIPENLSELFSTLVFQTNNDGSDSLVPLNMRGDGIQARHIPIILKYIADEDQKTRNQGSMKVATVWGFEEPENGVELSRAFEMANDFLDYSQDIQMFLTTHSPAFYLKKADEKSQVFYVSAGELANEGTKIKTSLSGTTIGENMGLMPLVAPYIEDKVKTISEAKKAMEENVLIDIPTIIVEGKTDRDYILKAIALFSPGLNDLVANNQLRIFTKEGQGGCRKLIDWAYVWIFSGNLSKAIVLFDKDEAGVIAHEELVKSDIFLRKRSTAAIQAKFLEPSETIISIYQKRIDIPYEIEHLLSIDSCKKQKKKKYFVERDFSKLVKMAGRSVSRTKGVDEVFNELFEDKTVIDYLLTQEPHADKKEKIKQYVFAMEEEEIKEALMPMLNTIKMLEKVFLTS